MVIGSPKGTSKDGSGLEDLWEVIDPEESLRLYNSMALDLRSISGAIDRSDLVCSSVVANVMGSGPNEESLPNELRKYPSRIELLVTSSPFCSNSDDMGDFDDGGV